MASDMKNQQGIISVIICTYNRASMLEGCLDSLCKQTLDSNQYDILVIDNNSSDDTAAVSVAYAKKCENIRYVIEERQGLSHARNTGCAEADTEYLIYLDDDTIIPVEYLSNVVSVIMRFSPDIMGGPIYPFYTSNKPFWFRDRYELRKNAEQSGFSDKCSISGGNFIVRKSVLVELGMFDPSYGMIGNRLRLSEERKVLEEYRSVTPASEQKVYYALQCSVKHHVPKEKMRITYLLKRSFLAGRSLSRIESQTRYKNNSNDIILRSKVGLFARKLYSLPLQIRQKGIFRLDYIAALMFLCVALGQLVGLLTNSVDRKKQS